MADQDKMLIWRNTGAGLSDLLLEYLRQEGVVESKSEDPGVPRFHSIEDHNFCISRSGNCPHCASGSKPVPSCLIVGVSD